MLDKSGFEVHSIIINDVVDYQYVGNLLNLEKESKGLPSFLKKIKKGFLLKDYLNKNNIKIIIDNRTRGLLIREIITKQIYGEAKKYYIVQNCHFEKYFSSSLFWTRILYKNAEKIIGVSKEIEQNIKTKFKLNNTTTIYNTFYIDKNVLSKEVKNPDNVVLFFGRFDEKAKNFTLMLDAFLYSNIFKKGYRLHLLGAGDDLAFIKKKIIDLGLESFVDILPFKKSPFEEVQKAKFTILTSNYEGFPLSIIESLALGTPVIAVDCHSGPREVIQNEFNGLLVEENNPHAFAFAMNRFVSDYELYNFCKRNASESVEHLSLENITKKWENLIQLN
ncbi:Group 1 glycosyl transferase [Flavobacterium aquidurense]|uniref:Group 1 glycosyl transferase n=2 Tax=Flavobacterium aquidurense TaxID=362413 RepID=A0A0Q0VV68_9FLAO|nr:Group 1 glycosyl transferase [Flavobacterium aquidurense]